MFDQLLDDCLGNQPSAGEHQDESDRAILRLQYAITDTAKQTEMSAASSFNVWLLCVHDRIWLELIFAANHNPVPTECVRRVRLLSVAATGQLLCSVARKSTVSGIVADISLTLIMLHQT